MNSTIQLTPMIETIMARIETMDHAGSPIVVIGQPGPLVSAACIACLKSGVPYLPIDSSYPNERIHYILDDSGAKNALGDATVRSDLVEALHSSLDFVQLSGIASNPEEKVGSVGSVFGGVENELGLRDGDEAPAYFIYTSGSTGNPKGISLSRGNLANQLSWLVEEGHLGPSVKVLQKTPIGFDAAQWELLAPACGSSVASIAPGEHRDPVALLRAIRDERVTSVQVVPTLLQALVDVGSLDDTPTLRAIYSGGEALSWRLVQEVRRVKPEATIINLYGPSECTINASAQTILPEDHIDHPRGASVPLGQPVRNTVFRIEDPEDPSQALVGEATGELLIGGAQVGIGYFGRPDETCKKFVNRDGLRFYRTGDLVRRDRQGNYIFVSRLDNQVKIRGNRVELDEISTRYESHPWVARAQCLLVPKRTESTDSELVACIQLDPQAAPLMDGSRAVAHHRSKKSKHQVKAQLSNPGLREDLATAKFTIGLNSRVSEALDKLRYARKSYRFFEPGSPKMRDLELIWRVLTGHQLSSERPQVSRVFDLDEAIQTVLQSVCGATSPDRLLPKYAYASPGALYSIQSYLETPALSSIDQGLYYLHPLEHTLHPVEGLASDTVAPRLHLVSRTDAIGAVYRNNVREVQYFELGHYLGLVTDVLDLLGFGYSFTPAEDGARSGLEKNANDLYLGYLEINTREQPAHPVSETPDLMVCILSQGGELKQGTYVFDAEGQLSQISDDYIRRFDVIAINQAVYDRSTYGIGLYFRDTSLTLPRQYIALGVSMHQLQAQCDRFGFMSSGYSSFSGDPLPASVHAQELLDDSRPEEEFAFYFALSGPITEQQRQHRGMNEDTVHMMGPSEIITEEMERYVPDYMIPDRIVVVESMPTTPNGKIDVRQLKALDEVQDVREFGIGREPQGPTEIEVYRAWSTVLKTERIAADDDFFKLGGDSIRVMMVVGSLREHFGSVVVPQLVFEYPVLEDFARAIDAGLGASRMVHLAQGASDSSDRIVIWPGLGGVPFGLRQLGAALGDVCDVYGIQSSGINPDEPLFTDIDEMAAEDINLLPHEYRYHLVGYSFGSRVAYSAASQMQQRGYSVGSLSLVCPGNPTLDADGMIAQTGRRDSSVKNPEFLGMLLSVFENPLDLDVYREAADKVVSLTDVSAFIADRYRDFEPSQVRRIVELVARTYQFDYTFDEMRTRKVDCPILVVKADGDQYSSIDELLDTNMAPVEFIDVSCDHYEILKSPHVEHLARRLVNFQFSQ